VNLYQRLVARGWWVILILCAGAMVWAGQQLPHFTVEAGTDVLLNEDDADLAYYNTTRAEWVYDEYIIVCCNRKEGWFTKESLALLNDFIRELRRLPHVKSITAITTVPLLRNQPPSILPQPITLVNPKTQELDPRADLGKARDELLNHTQALGNVISANGRDASVLVYVTIPTETETFEPERIRLLGRKDRDAAAQKRLAEVEVLYQKGKKELDRRRRMLVEQVRDLSAKWAPKFDEAPRLSGLSFINVMLVDHIQSDIWFFGILSLSFFTLTYLVIYRRLRWVLLPVVACALPVAIMLAVMVVMGKKVTVVTSNMPVLLFVLMLPYSVYYIERYCERRSLHPEEPGLASTTRAPIEIWAPCLYSCLATMAGTLAHTPSGINPVRTFGWMMTFGIAVGLGVIMAFLPATVVPLKTLNVTGWGAQAGSRGPLKLLETLVLRVPGWVVLFSLAVLGVSIWGTSKITVETKFIDYFIRKSPIYQGLDYIDNRMGGTTPLEVMLESDVKQQFECPKCAKALSPPAPKKCADCDTPLKMRPGFFETAEGLAALDAVAKFFDGVPETGNVRSLKTLADETRKGLMKGTKDEAIIRILKTVGKETVRDFCSEDFSTSRVQVRMKETAPTLNRDRILHELRAYLASIQDKELKGLNARPTGIFLLYSNMLNTLIAATRETFILAVVAIFLMLCWLFRSAKLAILVLLPQVLPVFLVLGTMGFTGIALDMVTVVIASVAMGVGIDAAIQYTVRFRLELAATGGDIREAVRRSHATIGRAIFIATSIVFAGFIILMFSNFKPTIWFGMFTGLAVIMGLFASLTTLPATFVLLNYPRLKPPVPSP